MLDDADWLDQQASLVTLTSGLLTKVSFFTNVDIPIISDVNCLSCDVLKHAHFFVTFSALFFICVLKTLYAFLLYSLGDYFFSLFTDLSGIR